mgnify:CR=1 FL=1
MNNWLISFKDVYSKELERNLTLEEIFSKKLAYTYNNKDFIDNQIILNECSPEENKDIFLEMHKIISNNIISKKNLMMDEIFKKCKPKYHYYGHFHSSWAEEINGCKHRLLDINELYEHKI